jgi:VIT1/CCC1 family predicted Fe2+/Mn2+ transporter
MRRKSSEKWWRLPEIQVENNKLKWLVNRSEAITAWVALTAVVVGVLTVFVAPRLWPVRLAISFLTLLFAFASTSRVNTLSVDVRDVDRASVSLTTVCPDCGEELGTGGSSCSNCGWRSSSS